MKTEDAQELAQTLFEEIGDAAFVVDPETMRLLDVNPMTQRLTGLSREELLPLSLNQLFRSNEDEGLTHLRHALHTTQTFHSQEGYHLRKGFDDSWTPVNLTLTRLHTERRPLGLVLARDVTERHQAEEQLRLAHAALERRVRERTADLARVNEALRLEVTEHKRMQAELVMLGRAVGAATQGIVLTDHGRPDDAIVFVSPGFERLTGYAAAEALDRNCRFLQGRDTDPTAVAQLRLAIRGLLPCTVEILNYRKDGTAFWNEVSLSPVWDAHGQVTHFVAVMTDVTERRKLEDQLRQAQKMEAVGQLAGGVAHDFNNLLTVITGYSHLLLGGLASTDPMRELLVEINKAGERAGTLTRQLLAFSRQQVLEPKVLNLNTVVSDTDKMLRRLIGEDVILTTTLDPTLGLVKADPGQVEQILINLAVNARDAMPTGGSLTIETRGAVLDETYGRTHADVLPGDYVLLAISDTGCGMDEATQARIFEPFFTTKGLDVGTGLGLATVHGIVKQSGGHVAVYSEVGQGSTFKIYLPQVGEVLPAGKSHSDAQPMPQGSETVLLVEDESAVRALAGHVLRTCGYHVLEAANGKEALQLATDYPGPIHLLTSDVVMPHLGGRKLAERIGTLRPECKVLFLSGYTDDAVVRHGVLEAEFAFLQKPFTLTRLAQKVREVLDGII